MKPYLCPVCNGRGVVPPGFYSPGDTCSTATTWETCRACDGKGVIYGYDTAPTPAREIPWNEPHIVPLYYCVTA